MPKTKISEFSSTPANNTDIDSINIAEGCAPSGINDAIRELMSQLKDWQSGTSNDPMVIGSSGSLTLNQGTANGVAYLNGSKVVTSGSALTFDGTTFRNTGGGAAFSGVVGAGISASVNGRLRAFNSTNDRFIEIYNDSTTSIINSTYGSAGASPLVFQITDSEQMRLTSTGLGIGTSSPSTKLDVSGAASTNSESRFVAKLADTSSVAQGNGGGLVFRGVYTGSTLVDASGIQAYKENSTDGNYAYGLAFVTRANGNNLTANMRLDGFGNLGLGVTPSAWNTYKALEIGRVGNYFAGYSGGTELTLGANAYYSTGWKYAVTGALATRYMTDNSGAHLWYTAPSGTAGNAITFTQAATLTADGDFLVGTTSSTGLSSNSKIVAGGKFRTVAGSVSAANGTATTLFTASGELGAYLVTVNVNADSVVYAATYVVNTQGGSSAVATQIYKGSLISISVSGLSVQATQSSGATQTIQYSAVRIF